MSKHKGTQGTQAQPAPMSSAAIAKTQAPGPKAQGFRPPRKAVNNTFNIDAGGRGSPAAVKSRLDGLDRARPKQTSGGPMRSDPFPKNPGQ